MTPLTEREMAVLRLTAEGATTNQMARATGVTPHAVEKVSQSLRTKLGARCAAHSVHLAHLAGLLSGQAGRDYIAEHRVQLAADLAQLGVTQ